MTPGPRQLHRAFLLRLWLAGNEEAPEWRMSLEDTRTHQRHGFADLASLVAFLEAQMGHADQPQPAAEPSQDEPN